MQNSKYFLVAFFLLIEIFSEKVAFCDEKLFLTSKSLIGSHSSYYENLKARSLSDDTRSTQLDQYQNYQQLRYPIQHQPPSYGYHPVNQYSRPEIPSYYRYGYPPDHYRPHVNHPTEITKNNHNSQTQQVQVQNINNNHYVNHQPPPQYSPGYHPYHSGYRFGLPIPIPYVPLSLHAHFGLGGGYGGGYGGYNGGAHVNNINNVQNVHEHICTHCHETNTYNEGDHYGTGRGPGYRPHHLSESDRDIDGQVENIGGGKFVGGETFPENFEETAHGDLEKIESTNYDQGGSNFGGESANYGSEAESFGGDFGGDSGGDSFSFDGGSSDY